VPGPGFRYQIDSTPLPVRVKFALADEEQVKATLYFVTDTYVKGIAGYYIGTKAACAELALKAFLQSTEDKGPYCVRNKVAVERNQWPMATVPEELVADRGELLGPVANVLVEHYGVNLDNCPAYSPQLKADVEASFGSLMRRLISKLDDHLPPRPGRRVGPDGGMPVLTMAELHVLMILFILAYNSRLLDRLPTPSEVRRKVKLTPTALWNTEFDRLRGEGRVFSSEELRLRLTKRADATLDLNGIQFEGLTFVCDADGVKDFQERRRDLSRKISIYYDEDSTDYVCVQAKTLKRLGIKTSVPSHKFIECSIHSMNARWAGYTFPRMRQDLAQHNETMQPAIADKRTADAKLLAAINDRAKAKRPTPLVDEPDPRTKTEVAAAIENHAADTRIAGAAPTTPPVDESKATGVPPPQQIAQRALSSLRAARARIAKPNSP
jgi:hypothetical protein